jgi:tRNA uracil 4-sulfurtransferase
VSHPPTGQASRCQARPSRGASQLRAASLQAPLPVAGASAFPYSSRMRIDSGAPSLDATDGRVAMVRMTGELTTKSRRTRSRFQRVLARNIRAALATSAPGCELREGWSRLFVRVPEGGSVAPLSRVFGISSYSILDGACEADLDCIVDCGRSLYAEVVRGRTYGIRVRRTGHHRFRSRDVAVRLGAALNEEAAVDLDDPEVGIQVEVRGERAYLFSSRARGAGGLPLGVEGRAVALISGGFDSAAAAWMMLRRGVELDYVFCNLGGVAYRRMTLEVAVVLADRWSHGTRPRAHVVEFGPVVEELRDRVPGPLLQVALKRQMYRTANLVAEKVGAQAVVTGESVGQVSSQTLANLRAIDGASALPVLRPLVGMEKNDIVALTRRIGTAALSARVREYCSIGDGRTATAVRPEAVADAEAGLDPDLLPRLAASAEIVDLRAVDLAELAESSMFVDEVEEEALRVDMRPEETRRARPWPRAVTRSYDELATGFKDLDRGRPIVLVCAEGLLSAQIAERMQEAGLEAYSLRGGDRGLRRLLAESVATCAGEDG